MKKIKFPSIPLVFLTLSVAVFIVVLLIGSIIKRLEVTIILLYIPIILGVVAFITSVSGLIKNKYNRTYYIVISITGIILTIFFAFFLLALQGLLKFT